MAQMNNYIVTFNFVYTNRLNENKKGERFYEVWQPNEKKALAQALDLFKSNEPTARAIKSSVKIKQQSAK